MTRRLTPEEAATISARAEPLPPDPPRSAPIRVDALEGSATDGRALRIHVDGPTVVVLASTTCDGCAELADLVAEGLDGAIVLGVLRAPMSTLPDPAIDDFTRGTGTWLVGDQPFDALSVTSTPFFCVLDATGTVVHEGVGFGRAHVEAQVADALRGTAHRDFVRFPQPTDAVSQRATTLSESETDGSTAHDGPARPRTTG